MVNKLSLLYKVGRNYISNINSYISSKKAQGDKPLYVFFDLNSCRTEIYYYALIFSFYEAGYTIFLRHDFMFIGNCFKAGKRIFEFSTLRIRYRLPQKLQRACILVSDHTNRASGKRWKKVVDISFDVYSEKHPQKANVCMPFPMSPGQYISGRFRQVETLRTSDRKMRIFFSGNQDREAYDHPVFRDFFQKLSRVAVIDTLVKGLSPEEIAIVEKKAHWQLLDNGYQNKLVLNRWAWSPSKSENLESRVSDEQWLETLAKSYFFLAPPGIRMPLCFNIIEAMSVGSIPITQYPEFFDPPLEHLKNALVFKSKDDLLRKIRDALSMDEKEINDMQAGVANYYDKFLQIDRLPHMINQFEQSNTALFINAEEVSYQDYLKERQRGSR